ncbi:TPA: hypothetical protein NBJ75_002062 [Serratia marcescens]|nr:hypothetical protein [Serratia marcescens]
MKIQNEIIEIILTTLDDYFPHALMSDGYNELLAQIEEDILDGHLIYLDQKGLISLPSRYRYLDQYGDEDASANPARGSGRWGFMTRDTFITAQGIDYLYSIKI